MKKYLLLVVLKLLHLLFLMELISNGKNAVIKFTGTITGNQIVTIA
jgi:hypothetical protein